MNQGAASRAPAWLVAWGIGGVVLLLSVSVWRLTGPVVAAAEHALGPQHLAVGVAWAAFMVYAEGWRGFHLQFSPRVVRRGLEMPSDRPLLVALAPAVCMGLLHGTRKRRIVAWALVLGIAAIVAVIRQVPQPWRGVIDLGVVLGLGTGTASILWHWARAAAGTPPTIAADWP